MKKQGSMINYQKQEISKKRHFAFRLNVFFFCTFVLFSVLIVRLALLQFVEGAALAAQEDQSTKVSHSIAPIRGNIYDREGAEIAYSTSMQSLFYRIEPGIKNKKDETIKLAHTLSEIFNKYGDTDSEITPSEIVNLMDVGFDVNKETKNISNYNFVPRRIKAGLSTEEIAHLSELRDQFKGIEIVEESVRNYSNETIAVQLVGYLKQFRSAKTAPDSHLNIYKDPQQTAEYLDTEGVGMEGIEFLYQNELRGKNGSKSYPVNAAEQIVGQVTITPPEKGNNLFLTIDKEVQLATEKAIEDHLEYMKSDEAKQLKYPAMGRDATTGYAVAMEVKTGKIVAMASYPDYDPNIYRGGRISNKDYHDNISYMKNGTINQSYADYEDETDRNNHPSSLVPLGSTIKPLTVLLGLNEGLITPNTQYNDQGVFYYGRNNDASIRNSDSRAYGNINALRAIEVSSNAFMSAMIGNNLYLNRTNPVDVWHDYMTQFGLGIKTGSGLPNESTGIIEYFHEAKTGSPQSALVFASFGQQGRYTTLQLAQYTATLANKGKRPKPQFVDKITTYDGKVLETFTPVFLNKVDIPEEYWKVAHEGMKLVRKQGFDNFPYEVASKTGTSQQDVGARKAVENAVFIAYAPADNPTLAVAVVVPDGGYGSWGAAPIARKIFDAYDEQIGLIGKEVEEQPISKTTPTGDLTPPERDPEDE
jgi:cell division protein FtsI/penicillin-binding protein 2